jgi:hypothetical protein
MEETLDKSVARSRDLTRDQLSTSEASGEKLAVALATNKPLLPAPKDPKAPPFDLGEAFRGIVELMHGTLNAALQTQVKLTNHNRDFGMANLDLTQSAFEKQRDLLVKQEKALEDIKSREGLMGKLNIALTVLSVASLGLSVMGGFATAMGWAAAKAGISATIKETIKSCVKAGVEAGIKASAGAAGQAGFQAALQRGLQVAMEQAAKAGADAAVQGSIEAGVRAGIEASLRMVAKNAAKVGVSAALDHAKRAGITLTAQTVVQVGKKGIAQRLISGVKNWLCTPLSQSIKFWTGIGGTAMGTTSFGLQAYFLYTNSLLQRELAEEQGHLGEAMSEMKEMEGFYRYFVEAMQRHSGIIHEHAGSAGEAIDLAGSYFKAELASAQMLARAI